MSLAGPQGPGEESWQKSLCPITALRWQPCSSQEVCGLGMPGRDPLPDVELQTGVEVTKSSS